MKTWGQLITELREELLDTATTPRWSDGLLYLFTCDALRAYSYDFPRKMDRVELALSGSSYPLPSDYLEDIFVENPEDRYLSRRDPVPGRAYNVLSKSTQYFIEGGALYLNGPTLEKVLLTYHALHPIPTSETDTAFALTIPDADIELIRLYVSAKIHGQMRAKQARLDRFDQGSGPRDDNPLLPEVNVLMREYERKVADRKGGGVVKLWRA